MVDSAYSMAIKRITFVPLKRGRGDRKITKTIVNHLNVLLLSTVIRAIKASAGDGESNLNLVNERCCSDVDLARF